MEEGVEVEDGKDDEVEWLEKLLLRVDRTLEMHNYGWKVWDFNHDREEILKIWETHKVSKETREVWTHRWDFVQNAIFKSY